MTTDYPRVSEIMAPYSKYDKARKEDVERGAIRGTAVHDYMAAIALELWYPTPPDEYAGYVISLERWFEKYVKGVVLVETTLVDPLLGYQGRPDLIVEMTDGVLTLPDCKTAQTKQKTWRGSLALYKRLAIVNGYPVEKVGSLQPKPDGSPAHFEVFMESPDDLSAAHAALIAYRYFCL